MPPKKRPSSGSGSGSGPEIEVIGWGLSRVCNFLCQDESSPQVQAFFTGSEPPQAAVAGAVALNALGTDPAHADLQRCASQVLEGVGQLTREGAPFQHVNTAFKVLLAMALESLAHGGASAADCLDRGIRATLEIHTRVSKQMPSEQGPLYASAALLAAAALLADWAKNQREVAPSIPPAAVSEGGLLHTLAACLENVPKEGEPSSEWEAAVKASSLVIGELERDTGAPPDLMQWLARTMLRTGIWAVEVLDEGEIKETKNTHLLLQLLGGLRFFMGPAYARGSWQGFTEEQRSVEVLCGMEGVREGVASLVIRLSRQYADILSGFEPLPIGWPLQQVSAGIMACLAAMLCWDQGEGDTKTYVDRAVITVLNVVEAYDYYFPLPDLNGRSSVMLEFALKMLVDLMYRSSDRVAKEVREALIYSGGVGHFLAALKEMESVSNVCTDTSPIRLIVMARLLSVLEGSLCHTRAVQEFLDEGGVQTVLNLAILRMTPKAEALLKMRDERLNKGRRFAAGLRSALSVVATLSIAKVRGSADAGEEAAIYANSIVVVQAEEVAGCGDLVRLLLWEPTPPETRYAGDFDMEAPSEYPLHESALQLLLLLSGFGPDCCLEQLVQQPPLLEALLRVGRSSIAATKDLRPKSLSALIMTLVSLAKRGLPQEVGEEGWGGPLWPFFSERATLAFLADALAAAAAQVQRLPASERQWCEQEDPAAQMLLRILRDGTALLSTLTTQAGSAGDALCVAACNHCLVPLRHAVLREIPLEGPVWIKATANLSSTITAAMERAHAVMKQQIEERSAQEDLAARAAAELLAEEEEEKSRAAAAQEKKKGKKKKGKKGAKKGAAPAAAAGAAAESAAGGGGEAEGEEGEGLPQWVGDGGTEQGQPAERSPPATPEVAGREAGEGGSSPLRCFGNSLERVMARSQGVIGAPNGLAALLTSPPAHELAAYPSRIALPVASSGKRQEQQSGAQPGGSSLAGSAEGRQGVQAAAGSKEEQGTASGSGRSSSSGPAVASSSKGRGKGKGQRGPAERQSSHPQQQQQQQQKVQQAQPAAGAGWEEPRPPWRPADSCSSTLAVGATVEHDARLEQQQGQHNQSWQGQQQSKQQQQGAPTGGPSPSEEEELMELMSHLLPGITLSPRSVPVSAPVPPAAPLPAAPVVSLHAPDPAGPLAGGSSSSSNAVIGAGGAADKLAAVRQLLTCPLTQQPLSDPVILGDGLSYERAAVAGRWEYAVQRPNFALRQLLESMGPG